MKRSRSCMHRSWFLGLVFILAILGLPPARPAYAATFTVITTADSGGGSLRWAINQANANVGPDIIEFNIAACGGPCTIRPTSSLPILTDAGTTIDGYTEPGSVPPGVDTPATIRIEIDGSLAGNVNGLTIISANNVVRGLAINRFAWIGVAIMSYEGSDASGNVVAGNHIGTDVTGMIEMGNDLAGVHLGPGAYNNIVGGPLAADRNVLSGNTLVGVGVYGAQVTGNVIAGNYIGTDATGAAALGNGYYGVRVYGGAHDNYVGQSGEGPVNVISGNAVDGVRINGAETTGNVVAHCRIGTDVDGTAALGNGESGVTIAGGAHGNTVGGGTVDGMNLISGNGDGVVISDTGTMSNTVAGNYIGSDAAGTSPLGNGRGIIVSNGAQYNRIGGEVSGEGNLISGNQFGVVISDTETASNTVSANLVGLDATGEGPLVQGSGIAIVNAPGNVVGGDSEGERNWISAHMAAGVGIIGPGATGNVVSGNYIGTNVAGDAALQNSYGILIANDAHDNLVGGNTPAARNLISGNNCGVLIQFEGTVGNVVAGNYIGTDAAGTGVLGNQVGVSVQDGAQSNLVGGDGPGEGNVIVGSEYGVQIHDSGTMSNTVSGNYIGTDLSGTRALDNLTGIQIVQGAQNNWIGGDTTGERNVIVNSEEFGIMIRDSGTMSNTISGNYIGTADGVSSLANRIGIGIEGGAQNNLIGGDSAAERNVISGNDEHGIRFRDSGTSDNTVAGNYLGADHTGAVLLGNDACGVCLEGGVSENRIGPGNLVSGNLAGVCISDTTTMSNTVFGNYIGTDATGAVALGRHPLGGVHLRGGAHDNLIGGATTAEANVISGNDGSGVVITGTGTMSNTVRNNCIGPAVGGVDPVGNGEYGVYIGAGAQNNTVGPSNAIAYNALDGVAVEGSGTYGNAVTTNNIALNAMGIHLLDGANGGILPPVFTATSVPSGSIVIAGTACAGCTVELFVNHDDDGEGENPLDSTLADSSGAFTFTVASLPLPYLTATATDAQDGTSEFSAVVVFVAETEYRVYLPVVMRNW